VNVDRWVFESIKQQLNSEFRADTCNTMIVVCSPIVQGADVGKEGRHMTRHSEGRVRRFVGHS